MRLSSIFKACSWVWRAKKKWGKPQSCNVVIYDREGADVFQNFFSDKETSILHTRGECVFFSVMLYSIMKQGIRVTFESYSVELLKIINPKVVITYVDNTTSFYKLKEHLPGCRFIAVQNGYRDKEFFKALESSLSSSFYYQCDAIFVFGSEIGKLYRKNISAEIFPIGNFKSNQVSVIKGTRRNREISFISQFRPPVLNDGIGTMPIGKKFVQHDKFYGAERTILPELKKFCLERGYDLKIIGTNLGNDAEETVFFQSIIGNSGWSFHKKETNGSIKAVDETGLVVFVDSTLGYEALARGAKVISVASRGRYLGADDRNFGWPLALDEKGPFWSDSGSPSEVRRLLSSITSISEEEWIKLTSDLIPHIMAFDEGTKSMLDYFNQINWDNTDLRPSVI